ncbi:hypothetical protein ACP4OV_016204 [Aristida adscensionis]
MAGLRCRSGGAEPIAPFERRQGRCNAIQQSHAPAFVVELHAAQSEVLHAASGEEIFATRVVLQAPRKKAATIDGSSSIFVEWLWMM